jgi:hypothetical protein
MSDRRAQKKKEGSSHGAGSRYRENKAQAVALFRGFMDKYDGCRGFAPFVSGSKKQDDMSDAFLGGVAAARAMP